MAAGRAVRAARLRALLRARDGPEPTRVRHRSWPRTRPRPRPQPRPRPRPLPITVIGRAPLREDIIVEVPEKHKLQLDLAEVVDEETTGAVLNKAKAKGVAEADP